MSSSVKIAIHAVGALLLFPIISTAQVPSPQNGAPRPNFRPAPPDPLRNTQPAVSDDWLTFSHDQQRTGWNNAEATFTTENVSHLKLLWSSQLSATPTPQADQTLTAPLVVSGVKTSNGTKTLAFTISGDSTLFAIDVDNGKVLWQKSFINPNPPIRQATWLCSDAEQATPVIDKDKGIIYFTTSDGDLRGASLADGSEKLTPTPFVAPYSRNWSLNLIDGWVYTTTSRGCGGDATEPIESGHVAAANVRDPAHVTVSQVYTGYGRSAGPWGRSGPVFGPQGVYVMTADGRYDPASGFFGNSVVAVRLGGYGIADSFTPSNWKYMNAHDLDLGAGSSVVFPFHGMALLAAGAKEGIEYLVDANELGGIDHSTPLYTTPKLGNDPDMLEQYGLWGGPATWQNANGDRFVYLPMMNAPSKDAPTFPHVNGDVSKGSIMAFQVVEKDAKKPVLEPVWISGVVQTPDMPAVANGIVFTVGTGEQTIENHVPRIQDLLAQAKFRTTPAGHQILYAFDAETGKQLYMSENILTNWDHFSQPVIADGKVFIVSYDAHVYAFGMK